jgi:hypothetical protein
MHAIIGYESGNVCERLLVSASDGWGGMRSLGTLLFFVECDDEIEWIVTP